MSNERTGVLELALGDTYIGSAYSPTVEVTDTDTGHEVAITYMAPSGLVTERFDVADGEQGPQGPAGYSPTVTITDTPTGHTVTITDEDGPHSYDVPNYAQEEQERQQAWDALSGEVADAITAAESATSAATTAAQSATSAATSATSAAQAATTAAASANTAASSANAAATAANSAATAAGTAADAATTAAGDATDAASAANTAAQAAQEAATELAPKVDAIADMGMFDMLAGIEWELGTIAFGTWVDAPATNRIRTIGYMPLAGASAVSFTVASGYKFVADWYDANKAGMSSAPSQGAWQTGTQLMSVPIGAAYLRILVADTSDGTASTDYAWNLSVSGATAIVAEVTSLRESIVPPDVNDYDGLDLGWVIGTLDTSTGREIAGTTRVRSTYIRVGRGTTLSIKDTSTYRFLYYMYELDGTFIDDTGWRATAVTMDRDYLIRILVCGVGNPQITQGELATYASQVVIDYGMPYSALAASSLSSSETKIYMLGANVTKKQQATIVKQKKTTSEAWGQCDLKMMYFTDVHGDATRTARMAELVNAWGTEYFNAAVCGGDIAQFLETEDVSWYYAATNGLAVPLLNVIGNHDAWLTGSGTLAAKTDVYGKFIAPTVAGSGIVQPSGADTNGYNYYYKDFNSTVRLVVLDCMYWDATQLSWFEGVLADAKANGLHVIACSHAAFPLADMEKVDCLWSKSGVNNDSTRTSVEAASAVSDFIDGGGTFVAWIVGHQHGDYVHKMPNYRNQHVINLASFANRAGWLLKNTDSMAYNYDCLTYVTVDATYKTLRLLRIGADIDIFGTRYEGLVFDYENGSVVSSW